ncbi:hypothetical protein LSAT2_003768 [Lamellibrachia satsuma]|nr:hypothetical protein LSAT2_003768 [Lamellibrachia satsuma]
MNRNRKPTESVPQYALALRELCDDCEYQATLQTEILRDVFLNGLNLPSVQAKVMLKDKTLTFENAYKEAVAEPEEFAAKCSVEFSASSAGGNGSSHATASANQVESVNRVQNFSKRKR